MNTNSIPMQTDSIAAEKAAIRQVFHDLVVAWNAGDAHAYASHFTENCDYVTFAGQPIKGRQSNERVHPDLFMSWALKGSMLHPGAEATISFLSSAVALMHSTGTVQVRFQKEPPL